MLRRATNGDQVAGTNRSEGAIGPLLILYNANVITVDPAWPRAQAVAILGDTIVAVGGEAAVCALTGPGTQKLDLEGRTVLPGFIDAHCHVGYAGRLHLRCVDCDLRSIVSIQQALRARARTTLAGEWVQGFKYDDAKTAERRFLTRDDLDAAAPHHPVFILHRGCHTAYVNSLALERAGITDSTADPPGGRLERAPDTGRLTGRVCETAMEPFQALLPSAFTRTEQREGVRLITQMMAEAGITSAHDALCTPEDLLAYQGARDAGELLVRVYAMIEHTHLDAMLAAGIRTGFGDQWVRAGGLKLMCDGSISERTARLAEPYAGRPDDYGILVMEEAELFHHARKAHLADWQIGVHANGDVAIDMVLGIYERLQAEHRRKDPRFRIEHCTVVNDELVRRIATLGAISTPFAAYVAYHGEKMGEYGARRLESMFALRSFLDAGIRAAPGSDYPPGPFEPLLALQSAVTRTDASGQVWGASQRISVEEAIRAGTLHGAYAAFEEGRKGSLERGKLADLVVLGADPTAVDPSALAEIPVLRTMVGGRWVYTT